MKSLQQPHTRIDLNDLKIQLDKKLGPDRSGRYFCLLDRFLKFNLSKCGFEKLCRQLLGREALLLHNQFMRAIYKNASFAKTPPPVYGKKGGQRFVGKKSDLSEDGHREAGSLPAVCQGQSQHVWSNGDALPVSPRKCRSALRGSRDRSSHLGSNGKIDLVTHPAASLVNGTAMVATENGGSKLHELQRPLHHHHQGHSEHPDGEQEPFFHRPTKRPRTKKSPDDPVSLQSTGPIESFVADDGDVAQEGINITSARSPLRAPLGIPFCPASVGGARKALPPPNSNNFAISSDCGVLYDTETLRRRMEQIVGSQGLEGVSIDCANLLNNGLDVYLKRLLRSCIELVGSRSGQEPVQLPVHKQKPHSKFVNGIKPEYQLHMQKDSRPMDCIQELATRPISLLDFKVAMELNPQQLGEDWPLLLEKICMHDCEE